MANTISVTIYDFGSAGNKLFKTYLMGLPSAGAFVSGMGTAPFEGKYVYSKITYPALGISGKEYLTAETVQSIINKMNA